MTDSTDTSQRTRRLERKIKRLTEENTALQGEVSELRDGVRVARQKYKDLWRMNCVQLGEYDSLVALKEEEIEDLKR